MDRQPRETTQEAAGETQAEADDLPVFRAVNTPAQRRGLRLEIIYWNVLKMLSKSANQSLGAVVGATADGAASGANLASLLRVRATRWLLDRVDALERLSRPDVVNAIIQASPSPAFVLTEDRRILFYNPAFLNLIQAQVLGSRPNLIAKGLRLSLDMQLEEVIARLSSGQASTVASGYVIGVEGQRLRGTVNMVLAPVHDQTMVIAFVARG